MNKWRLLLFSLQLMVLSFPRGPSWNTQSPRMSWKVQLAGVSANAPLKRALTTTIDIANDLILNNLNISKLNLKKN